MQSLKQYNTFNLDLSCQKLLLLESLDDYKQFQQLNTTKLLLGGGSDILLTSDFNGTVGITHNKGISIEQDQDFYYIRAEAGTVWHELVTYLIDHNIGGLENLALIPGCCGAAPVQNIGAYGLEFDQVCDYVEVIDQDLSISKISTQDCNFGYRFSNFKTIWKDRYIIIAIGLKLAKKWNPRLDYAPLRELKEKISLTPKDVFNKIIEIRKAKLPDHHKLGNAGSFFKNPIIGEEQFKLLHSQYESMPYYDLNDQHYKIPAGWLIDQCGLKGKSIGGAQVYEKQALVIINKDHALPHDVIQLAKYVIDCVKNKFNIQLEPEIRIFNGSGETTLEQL